MPHRPFPFNPSVQALPKCIPDCHLVRTVIPCLPSYDSLGDFHNRTNLILASFASMVSKSYCSEAIVATNRHLRKLFSPHVHSRQATLHIAHDSVHHFAGSYLIRTRSGFPNTRSSQLRRTSFKSPRKPGRMLHAIGARPRSLTPSTHPKLGVKSRHQGLHRCALHRIFRPYLEEAVLTRILRRQNVYYHIIYEYSRGIAYIEHIISRNNAAADPEQNTPTAEKAAGDAYWLIK